MGAPILLRRYLAVHIAVVTGLCAGLSRQALAQQTPPVLQGATITEDEGLRISDQGRIHFFGNLDLHWDSNPNYLPVPIGDLVGRIRLGLRLRHPSEKLDITFGGFAEYLRYFGLVNSSTEQLSNIEGEADLALNANRSGVVSLYFNDNFIRSAGPSNAILARSLFFTSNFAQLGTYIRPGGRAFEISPAFGVMLTYFDPTNQPGQLQASSLSNITLQPHLHVLWRFFPKTAVFVQGDGEITRYPWAAGGATQEVTNVGLDGVNVTGGLQGLITDKLTVVLSGGWGDSFAVQPAGTTAKISNFNSGVGRVNGTWKPSDFTILSLEYNRGYFPESIFIYYSQDQVLLNFQQVLFYRFMVKVHGEYDYQAFGQGVPVNGNVIAPRIDNYIKGELRFTYQVRNWIAGSVYYMPEFRISNFVTPPPSSNSASYSRHVAGLDLTLAY